MDRFPSNFTEVMNGICSLKYKAEENQVGKRLEFEERGLM